MQKGPPATEISKNHLSDKVGLSLFCLVLIIHHHRDKLLLHYLKNLFSYIVSDLSGIAFREVQFEWGILATDLKDEVKALNSPITFTVIDTTYDNNGGTMLQAIPYLPASNTNSTFNLFGVK